MVAKRMTRGLEDNEDLNNAERLIMRRNDCPSLYGSAMCFVRGNPCQFMNKDNCPYYWQWVKGKEAKIYASVEGQQQEVKK